MEGHQELEPAVALALLLKGSMVEEPQVEESPYLQSR
jgi:hypothetical protein